MSWELPGPSVQEESVTDGSSTEGEALTSAHHERLGSGSTAHKRSPELEEDRLASELSGPLPLLRIPARAEVQSRTPVAPQHRTRRKPTAAGGPQWFTFSAEDTARLASEAEGAPCTLAPLAPLLRIPKRSEADAGAPAAPPLFCMERAQAGSQGKAAPRWFTFSEEDTLLSDLTCSGSDSSGEEQSSEDDALPWAPAALLRIPGDLELQEGRAADAPRAQHISNEGEEARGGTQRWRSTFSPDSLQHSSSLGSLSGEDDGDA